jgi:hypothetical protein
MELLTFVLVAYGMTLILAYGKVLDKIRPDYYFFRCPMCLGFWVGVFLCAINSWTGLFTFDCSFVTAFLLGCLSSGTSYALTMLFDDYGVNINLTGGDKT